MCLIYLGACCLPVLSCRCAVYNRGPSSSPLAFTFRCWPACCAGLACLKPELWLGCAVVCSHGSSLPGRAVSSLRRPQSQLKPNRMLQWQSMTGKLWLSLDA